MVYLITQILVVLLFTAALALIAGWLLRGVGFRPQLEALEREREELRRRAATLEARIAEMREKPTPAAAGTQRSALVQSRPESAASNQALNTLRERVAQLDAIARSQADRIAELGQRLREKDELIEGLKLNAETRTSAERPARPLSKASAPPNGLLPERPVETDRLQAIAGIGPVLERVLNELGIYRFGQLARLTPDNIQWLASRIDWFPQRIQREDWVGQARRLHGEVHPEEEI